MRVYVDPSGGDQQAIGIDGPLGRPQISTHIDDLPVCHGDVGALRLCARSVDDSPVLDQQIVHVPNLPMRRKSLTSLIKIAKNTKKVMLNKEIVGKLSCAVNFFVYSAIE